MIVLYIIGCIAALLVLLLLASVSVRCRFDDDISVKVGFLFIRKRVLPTHKPDEEEEKPEEPHPPKKNYVKQMIEEKGVVAALTELAGIAKALLQKAGSAAKHIRVKRFDMLVVAASDDPAKTAVEYGVLCGTVFPLLSGFQQLLKWNNKKTSVSVKSNFCSENPTLLLDMKLKLRLWFIVKAVFGVFWILIKQKIKASSSQNSAPKSTKVNNKPR